MRRRSVLRAAAAALVYASKPVSAAMLAPASGLVDARALRPPAAVKLTGARYRLLEQTVGRLRRVQKTVGYGNFNLLGFDAMLRVTRAYPAVGELSAAELSFLEEIFFEDATQYGFYGAKVLNELTATIAERDTYKVSGTGHYLFRGKSLEFFHRVRRDVGESLVLTSGIRGIVKQMYLFLSKAIRTEGDLGLAAHSLAPPGHSYHGVGDFDVGRRGFGVKNFSPEFAATLEFRRLTELGYVFIRYPEGNADGVRFEPWHIRVV